METSQTRTFPARFDSLAPIAEFIIQAAESAGLDDRQIYAVQLAVDEACSNIIQHAYGGEERGEITCTYHITDEGVTIILHDDGRPFNPAAVPEPPKPTDLDMCTGGGLGLYFMRQLMDKVHFEFAPDSGNTLTMTKYKSAG